MRDQDMFLERALVASGHVAEAQLEIVRRAAIDQHVDLVDALAGSKLVSGARVAMTRASICEVAFVDLADYETNFANARLVPRTLAERYSMFPLFMIDGLLTLAR